MDLSPRRQETDLEVAVGEASVTCPCIDLLRDRQARGLRNALAGDFITAQTSPRAGTGTKPAVLPLGSLLNTQLSLARSSCLSLLCRDCR